MNAQNRQNRRGLRPAFALSALALTGLIAACGSDESGGEASEPIDFDLAVKRERVAALFEEDNKEAALELVRPLADLPEADKRDLIAAAVLELHQGELEAATGYAQRAAALDASDPVPEFLLGHTYNQLGELELAVEHFRGAFALAPEDVPSELALASALDALDESEQAAAHYHAILEADPNEWGAWMVTAAYRLGRVSLREGDDEAYAAAREKEKELREGRGLEPPSPTDMMKGELGRIPFPLPMGSFTDGPGELTANSSAGPAELAGFENLAAWMLGPNWVLPKVDDMGNQLTAPEVGRSDLIGWGGAGLRVAFAEAEGWRVVSWRDDAIDGLWPIDWDDDGWLDFALVADGKLLLQRYDPAAGELVAGPTHPELPSLPSDARAVDYDHDGDADLLLVGQFGARIWRNDGLHVLDTEGAEGESFRSGDGAFVDATEAAGLPTNRGFTWCLTEDLDVDQDVDLLFGSAEGPYLADNRRGGAFADRTADLGTAPIRCADFPVVADFNGDELPDIWFSGVTPQIRFGTRERTFRKADATGVPGHVGVGPVFADLDLDGSGDALWLEDGALVGRLSLGREDESSWAPVLESGITAFAVEDHVGAGRPGVALASAEAVDLQSLSSNRGGIRLALQGDKDNYRGLGATVELRAGPIYRRFYWRGNPEILGLGEQASADILRITWPNGVVQNTFDIPRGSQVVIKQVERLAGSCPFLYTWNGLTYEFVSDVLGITPLGLPMAPGMLVPPDHDEYILVSGEQLRPRHDSEGLWYDMQITEELREVTYLDHAKLLVVDHPEGSELYPNELFCFPPFPERHEHVVGDVHAPVSAPGGTLGSANKDWADQLARIDGHYAMPFDGYQDQFQGIAPPWTQEIAFDADVVRAAVEGGQRLRLLCTGWLLWSNASVNMAAARTPGVDFVPPILQVPSDSPEAENGWLATGPPIGFPAGKTKTMVIDVTDLLDPADPRLRLLSTLCLYWDSIRLAVGDDEPTEIVELAPVTADLWERGFSQTFNPSGEYKLEWFLWSELMPEPPWNAHPGSYTRLGDTRPLLTDIDDMFIVMAAGDALNLRFDASEVPPLEEGWRRDFLLFLDGWAKDRDPNTVDALEVEPFPFHGMSGYPYGPDEAFPDTAEHRQWRKEWQTRPAKRWIEPLSE